MSELAGGQLTARAAQIAAVLAKHGLKAGQGGRGRPAGPAARGARGARADVLQARPDALDPPRPDSARARRRAREPSGPRAAAERGRGRAGDGGGARRPLGGRVREHRARAAGRGHDRPGAQGPPRGRRPGGGQGPATERRGRDRARSRPVRTLRREGRGARGPLRTGRHPGRCRASLGIAPPRARLPRGGGEHRADARGAGSVPAAGRPLGAHPALEQAAPRHGRGRRRPAARGACRRRAPRGRTAAAGGVLPPGADGGLLPCRPASRQPALERGPHLPARPRDGRDPRRRHPWAAAADAARVLARGRGVPRRRPPDARRGRPRRRHRGRCAPISPTTSASSRSARSATSSSARCSTR